MIGRVSTKFGLTRRLDDTKFEHGGSLSSGHGRQIFSAAGAAHRQNRDDAGFEDPVFRHRMYKY